MSEQHCGETEPYDLRSILDTSHEIEAATLVTTDNGYL